MSTSTDDVAAADRPEPPGDPTPGGDPRPPEGFDGAVATARALHTSLASVLLGAPRAVTVAVLAAVSGHHLLIEDVPGVGKTVLAGALARALGVPLARIQGHPDLLPSDVTGVTVFAPDTGTWEFRPGPVFAHVVLLDELNRTPPRTQSALLEVMEEQQVTVDGETRALPRPHLVVATQNPAGQLGTFPLVESQLDRFGLSTGIGYPDAATERDLVLRRGGRAALGDVVPVTEPGAWDRVVATTAAVRVTDGAADYAVALVRATRQSGGAGLGASPRATITLIRVAQAYATLNDRPYVTPEDIQAVATPCLAHRLAVGDVPGAGADAVARAVAATPVPPV